MRLEELERVVGSVLRGAKIRPMVVVVKPEAKTINVVCNDALDRGMAAIALRQIGLRVDTVGGTGLAVRAGR